jgi:putative transcriptional regulator
MIKHHPSNNLLAKYCSGSLEASLSVAVSIHVDMCPVCQAKVAHFEAQNAQDAFDINDSQDTNTVPNVPEKILCGDSSLLNFITADDTIDEVYDVETVNIEINNNNYELPRALTRIPHGKFTLMGKLARSRVAIDDGPLRSSLLHIGAGGEIPEHTHTGFEVTLLLDGEFSDEAGDYVAGDFIWQDQHHEHTPVTKNGCLCFTVVSSALHFNKGMSKLLNPIGQFIY